MGSWIYPVVWSPTGQRLAYIERHFAALRSCRAHLFVETIDTNGRDSTVVLDDDPGSGWLFGGPQTDGFSTPIARAGERRSDYGISSVPS